jgi:hypothetical protein
MASGESMLRSQICRLDSLTSLPLRYWSDQIRPIWDPDGTDPRPMIVHRKMWEWLFICQALAERDMLRPGRTGVGFGVGVEPLVALFAARGCRILATDLHAELAQAAGWTDTGQEYSGGLERLNESGLCPRERFEELVTYRHVDMRSLPAALGPFDFSWSSCAFEHLGSLEAGAEFVLGQMDFVAPGGVAVHTTEYNVSSDDDTVDAGGTVLYRRRDLLDLAGRLTACGYEIHLDLSEGDAPEDQHIDVPPFTGTHLKTKLGEFVTTSVALIIEKPADWQRPRAAAMGRHGHGWRGMLSRLGRGRMEGSR